MGTILITGASGFIGSFLVEEGLRQGYTVYAAIRPTSKLTYLRDKNIELIWLDLSNKRKLKNKWQELKAKDITLDYVIHNAGLTLGLTEDEYDRVNHYYTRNLYESLCEAFIQPRKFILVSSLAALGPGNETTFTPITINQKAQPLTPYGRSKLKAEQFIMYQNEIPYLIFRPTGVYGPRDNDYLQFFKTIKNHLEPYLGSPEQRLSFIYVKDLARLIIQSLAHKETGKTYNVSDGKIYTCRQFAEIVKQELNSRTIKLHFPKALLSVIASILGTVAQIKKKPALLNKDKLKELTALNWGCESKELQIDFQFEAQYDLEAGVKDVIKWYKNNQLL